MEQQVTIIASFSGFNNVRIIKDPLVCQEPFIPLVDIASAIDYDHRILHKYLNNNQEALDQSKCVIRLFTNSEKQKSYHKRQVCLMERGVYGLLMMLQADMTEDATKRQRVVSFQSWVQDVVTQMMRGEIPDSYVPPSIQELILIPSKSSWIRAAAVKKLASDRGVSESTIYREIKGAREKACLPPSRKIPKTRGTHKRTDEYELLKRVLPECRHLALHVIKSRYNLEYSTHSIGRIRSQLGLKKLRAA